jgi:hypothetical protein
MDSTEADLGYAEGPCDLANRVPFTALCDVMTRVMNKKKQALKLKALDLEGLRKSTTSPTAAPQTMYPIMRLLMPAIDRGRAVYNIQITKLVELYVKSLGIDDRNNKWANTLRGWKDPNKLDSTISTATGDFPQVLKDVLVSRGRGKSTDAKSSLAHESLTVRIQNTKHFVCVCVFCVCVYFSSVCVYPLSESSLEDDTIVQVLNTRNVCAAAAPKHNFPSHVRFVGYKSRPTLH